MVVEGGGRGIAAYERVDRIGSGEKRVGPCIILWVYGSIR